MTTSADPVSIQSLPHLALNVTGMEASATFYPEVLGFQQLCAQTGVVAAASSGFLTPSGVMVELLHFAHEDGSLVEVDTSRDTVRLAFSVADMDQAKAALKGSGVEPVAPWSSRGS